MSPEWQQKMREMIDRRTKENRMSDTTEAALTGLRERLRDLELDACAVRSRVEEVRSLIELLEHGTRRRPVRPRNASAINPALQQSAHAMANPRTTILEMPKHVEGGVAGSEASLPSLDDVRGILRTKDTAA
jgi:hypothetical protein